MILTDGIHVTSTESLEELHSWAASVGLKRHWFHGARKGHPHYDVPKTTRLYSSIGFSGKKILWLIFPGSIIRTRIDLVTSRELTRRAFYTKGRKRK